MFATASSVAAHHGNYEDLEAGMDVPVTEDVVRALVTRMLRDDNRRIATRSLQTAVRFEREDDDEEAVSDE